MFGLREGCIAVPGTLEMHSQSVYSRIVTVFHMPSETNALLAE